MIISNWKWYGMNKEKVIKVLTLGTIGSVTLASGIFFNKKYKLQKEYNSYQMIDTYPNIFKNNDNIELNKEYVSSLFIKEDIFNFIEVMSSKKLNIDLNNFYKNLNSLSIENRDPRKEKFIPGGSLAAYYIPSYNTLVVNEDDYKEFINHELLHVTVSRENTDGSISCGFLQYKDGVCIGSAIDEGCTQLFSERYFNEEETGKDVYVLEKLVVSLLEDIIGSEKLEELYFQSDLGGLVDELSKYVDREEVLKFIYNLDFYSYYCLSFVFEHSNKLMYTCLNEIGCFLFKTYYSKLLIENKEVDLESVNKFIKTLMSGIYIGRKKVEYFDIEDESRIINDVYKNKVKKKEF